MPLLYRSKLHVRHLGIYTRASTVHGYYKYRTYQSTVSSDVRLLNHARCVASWTRRSDSNPAQNIVNHHKIIQHLLVFSASFTDPSLQAGQHMQSRLSIPQSRHFLTRFRFGFGFGSGGGSAAASTTFSLMIFTSGFASACVDDVTSSLRFSV